jgi:hypothetical protein
MKTRYNKKYAQEEARNLVNRSNRSTPLQQHQASLAWTPPPIYTAVSSQDQASTSNTHIEMCLLTGIDRRDATIS